eukprot:m.17388 g.17388  ORF g.17388 m.17388 type:complete len:329 (-) comp7435_c1_seq1:588-1574(-)
MAQPWFWLCLHALAAFTTIAANAVAIQGVPTPVAMLHIHKTGGTSFAVAEANWSSTGCRVSNGPLMRQIEAANGRVPAYDKSHLIRMCTKWREITSNTARLIDERLGKVKDCTFLDLHLDFSTFEKVPRLLSNADVFTFTMLREPLSRSVSAYIYSGNAFKMDFVPYLDSRDDDKVVYHMHDYAGADAYVERLSGTKYCSLYNDDEFKDHRANRLVYATKNLRQLSFVGITECFSLAVQYINAKTGANIKVMHANSSTKRGAQIPQNRSKEAIYGDTKLLWDIRGRFHEDLVLYELAKARFVNQLATIGLEAEARACVEGIGNPFDKK